MPLEIERKFLVKGDFKRFSHQHFRVKQAYISSVSERTVRIRVKDQQAYITIKGSSDKTGTSRFEWEREIPVHEADDLLKICEPGIIDKTRYLVLFDNHIWEVDEFHGENEGLLIAELELNDKDESFKKPEWLGEEVTGDVRYYNSSLIKHPYTRWRQNLI